MEEPQWPGWTPEHHTELGGLVADLNKARIGGNLGHEKRDALLRLLGDAEPASHEEAAIRQAFLDAGKDGRLGIPLMKEIRALVSDTLDDQEPSVESTPVLTAEQLSVEKLAENLSAAIEAIKEYRGMLAREIGDNELLETVLVGFEIDDETMAAHEAVVGKIRTVDIAQDSEAIKKALYQIVMSSFSASEMHSLFRLGWRLQRYAPNHEGSLKVSTAIEAFRVTIEESDLFKVIKYPDKSDVSNFTEVRGRHQTDALIKVPWVSDAVQPIAFGGGEVLDYQDVLYMRLETHSGLRQPGTVVLCSPSDVIDGPSDALRSLVPEQFKD